MAKVSCLFGESGLGKSTSAYYLAKLFYELYGKPVRLISAESVSVLEPLIKIGVVKAVNVTSATQPISIMKLLATGYFPKEIDPVSYIPILKTKSVNDFYHPFTAPDGFRVSDFSCYIVEGISSIADIFLNAQKGKKLGINPAWSETFTNDYGVKETQGAISRDAYGHVQGEILDMIVRFRGLPIERVHFSAHEVKGVDEDSTKPIRGIAVVGQAATDKIGRKLDEILHIDLIEVAQGKREIRVYFQPHPDQVFPSIMYKSCKARVSPENMHKLLEKFPNGYFVPTIDGFPTPETKGKGLDEFIKFEMDIDNSSNSEDNAISRWKAEIDAKFKAQKLAEAK